MLSLFPQQPSDSDPARASKPPLTAPPQGFVPAEVDGRQTLVLLNPRSGTLAKTDPAALVREIAQALPGARVELLEPGRLIDAARDVSQDPLIERVIVGGGDGTVNAVAHELVGSGKELCFLQMGTMNYLAREVGVPPETTAALRWMNQGATPVPTNVGQVNGRTFCLFAEIGMYGLVVRHRDIQRKATGRSKYFAMIVSFWRALRRKPVWRLTIEHDGKSMRRTTPLLYIGLSDYHMDVLGLPPELKRRRATLSLLVARETSRLGFILLLLRSFTSTIKVGRDLECLAGDRFVIRSRRESLRVAMDGEVLEMNTPLTVELVRDGLVLLVDPAEATRATSA